MPITKDTPQSQTDAHRQRKWGYTRGSPALCPRHVQSWTSITFMHGSSASEDVLICFTLLVAKDKIGKIVHQDRCKEHVSSSITC